MAASAASILAMLSVMMVFILAVSDDPDAAGVVAVTVAAGVAVTVVPGAAVTVVAGAAVTAGSGAGVGVTVTAGAAAGSTAGAAGGFGEAVCARAGIHIKESATMVARKGLGKFMVVLLGSALDEWWGVPPVSSVIEGPGWDWDRLRTRHLPSLLARAWAAWHVRCQRALRAKESLVPPGIYQYLLILNWLRFGIYQMIYQCRLQVKCGGPAGGRAFLLPT